MCQTIILCNRSHSLILIYLCFYFSVRNNVGNLDPRSPRSTSSSTSSSPTFLTGGIATVKKDLKNRQKGSERGSVDPFVEKRISEHDRSLRTNTNSSSRELQEYLQVCIITWNCKINFHSLSLLFSVALFLFVSYSFSFFLSLLLSLSVSFTPLLFLSLSLSLFLSLSVSICFLLSIAFSLSASFSLITVSCSLLLFFSLFPAPCCSLSPTLWSAFFLYRPLTLFHTLSVINYSCSRPLLLLFCFPFLLMIMIIESDLFNK